MQRTLEAYRASPVKKPSTPMATQGPSYRNPAQAAAANKAYTKTYGFANRVAKSNFPSAMGDITDLRKMTGPYDPRDPKYVDMDKQRFNPNNPLTRQQADKAMRTSQGLRDSVYRGIARDILGDATPQELRGLADQMRLEDTANFGQAIRDFNLKNKNRDRSFSPSADSQIFRKGFTDFTPDMSVGSRLRRDMNSTYTGYPTGYRETIGNPYEIGFRKGGLVKSRKKK